MKFSPCEQNLAANNLKSKCSLTLMLIMYIVLKKYDPYEPCHISGTSRAINLKLLQVTPIDKNMLTNDILVTIISL